MVRPVSALTPDEWDDLDGTSLVPTGKTAQELDHGPHAKTSVAAGVSLGTGHSTQKNVNQVAQFKCNACGGSGRQARRAGWYVSHPWTEPDYCSTHHPKKRQK